MTAAPAAAALRDRLIGAIYDATGLSPRSDIARIVDAVLPVITPEDFRTASLARARQNDTDLTHWQARLALYGLGLTGEAGEVADEVKKVLFHDKPLDRAKLVNESGDVLWYLDRLLYAIDATLEDAMEANRAKLAIRYPAGFDGAERKHGFSAEEGA